MVQNEMTLVFNIFIAIGVYFREQSSSKLKRCLKKILEIYFHVFSAYFIILCPFIVYYRGSEESEHFVATVYFFLAALLRLHIVFKIKKIFEICKYTTDFVSACVPKPRRYAKICIFTYFVFILVLSSFVSYQQFLLKSNLSQALQVYKYLLFEYPVSSEYFLILTSILEFSRNFLEIGTPALTVILLSVLYNKLIVLMKQSNLEIDDILKNRKSESKQLMDCTQILSATCKIVNTIDKEMSIPLFYLISMQILQIMWIISIFAEPNFPDIVSSIIYLFLAANAFLSLMLVINLASKIPEIFVDIKTKIITSDFVKMKIYSAETEAISIIGLGNVLNEMVNSYQITVFGVKIHKSMIITLFCSLITYGVILFQIVENKKRFVSTK